MELLTTLLPHQQAAVDKLIGIRVGALYMEMGTGKTRTALEMIKRRLDAGKINRVLWLCPCSVKNNLQRDLEKHAASWQDVIAIHGIESLSGSIKLYQDLYQLTGAGETMLVVDESNLVKNHRALRTKRVTDIAARCRYRLILNGTPISRNEADLYAQWNLLDWRILGYQSYWSFAANHLEYDPVIPGKVRRTLNTDYLIEKIAPYSYQAYLKDCVDLPYKKYCKEYTRLTKRQDAHYDEVMGVMLDRIDEMRPETIYRMFAAAQAIISGLWVTDDGKHMKTAPMFEDPLDNPRIQTLMDIISGIDGQAVIFCKFTHEIESILKLLPDAVPFYGDLNNRARQKNLDAFRGGTKFLVANKTCAGYGLNLQFCHNVIYYSNDWDWATRVQSEDRVYRIGQTDEVTVYDICAANTLDERILSCLERKERLEDALKRELNASNSRSEARGKYQKWLRGEVADGKSVS